VNWDFLSWRVSEKVKTLAFFWHFWHFFFFLDLKSDKWPDKNFCIAPSSPEYIRLHTHTPLSVQFSTKFVAIFLWNLVRGERVEATNHQFVVYCVVHIKSWNHMRVQDYRVFSATYIHLRIEHMPDQCLHVLGATDYAKMKICANTNVKICWLSQLSHFLAFAANVTINVCHRARLICRFVRLLSLHFWS
jgi:hypothetical protein